jgi:hypothetical protein
MKFDTGWMFYKTKPFFWPSRLVPPGQRWCCLCAASRFDNQGAFKKAASEISTGI